jgi:hypothetical protein
MNLFRMIAAFFLAVTLVLPGRRLVLDVDSHLSGFTRLQPGIRPEADGRSIARFNGADEGQRSLADCRISKRGRNASSVEVINGRW